MNKKVSGQENISIAVMEATNAPVDFQKVRTRKGTVKYKVSRPPKYKIPSMEFRNLVIESAVTCPRSGTFCRISAEISRDVTP